MSNYLPLSDCLWVFKHSEWIILVVTEFIERLIVLIPHFLVIPRQIRHYRGISMISRFKPLQLRWGVSLQKWLRIFLSEILIKIMFWWKDGQGSDFRTEFWRTSFVGLALISWITWVTFLFQNKLSNRLYIMIFAHKFKVFNSLLHFPKWFCTILDQNLSQIDIKRRSSIL
jgi:hypothetical protein